MSSEPNQPLLEVTGLKTYFQTDDELVKAVDDISLEIQEGQTLGLVGESGSGKSVTSLTIMGLLPEKVSRIPAGKIAFLGKDIVKLPDAEMRKIRGWNISMIFQEPGTSLNPVHRVGRQVMETIQLHEDVSKEEAEKRTIELFKEVGIPDPERRIKSYPHEMSGGQKQRVMIAMAIACNPKLLIADEPTTALDVTIQMQILDLIRKLRDERGMSILFITHDLGVIAEIADQVAVMFRGKLVEMGPVMSIFTKPKHPYTKGLLACRPKPDTDYKRLPAVADFMDVSQEEDGGPYRIVERSDVDAHIKELTQRGRGRLLHPISELEAIGHPFKAGDHPDDTTTVAEDEEPLLEVSGLKVHFPIKKGFLRRTVDHVRAVDGLDFKVYRGQTLGLVGESGCGKTTTGRAILQLVHNTAGNVKFDGKNVFNLRGEALRELRGRMQIIFQDPYGSLNPRMTIGAAIMEAMEVQGHGTNAKDRRDKTATLLEEVGLLADHLPRYPHEFSGGQRQRVCIARALAVEPEFIVCDESVSALDVSVQAQVLNLLRDLQEARGLTYIFISHDLSVVKFISDMIAVMNDGKILSYGPSDGIYANPENDYTRRLIESIPDDSIANIEKRQSDRREAAQTRLAAKA